MIADKVKSQVTNALVKILDILKEAVAQLFCEATLSAQNGFCTVVYDNL